jgi:S1-C subfamily serine protease
MALTQGLMLSQTQRALTQKDIDAAVLKTLETQVLPSAASRAYEAILPSVVRVMAMGLDKEGKQEQRSVGTGVVIVDKGIILTNLHVVQGAPTIRIEFADGMESTASVISVQPENDLAVLQAHQIPDDMIAATMRSTKDLAPGDQVLAVGFPFGIGPSASAGVISGLRRSFRSPEGKQEMTNLIQFDAAANPGNSGGPLVTMDGQVVGIVTAIYNPSSQRTFIGIGFAVPIENAASAVGLPPF